MARGRSGGRGRGGQPKGKSGFRRPGQRPVVRRSLAESLHFPEAVQEVVCDLLRTLRQIEDPSSSSLAGKKVSRRKILEEFARRDRRQREKEPSSPLLLQLPNGKPALAPRVRLELRVEGGPFKGRPLVVNRRDGLDVVLKKAKQLLKTKRTPLYAYRVDDGLPLDLATVEDGAAVYVGDKEHEPAAAKQKKDDDEPVVFGSLEAWELYDDDKKKTTAKSTTRRTEEVVVVSSPPPSGGTRRDVERPLTTTTKKKIKDDKLQAVREGLPAFREREAFLSLVRRHEVVVVSGATGCGKSTQFPQFLVEDADRRGERVKVVVTEPRRIAAIGLAQRVAKEYSNNNNNNNGDGDFDDDDDEKSSQHDVGYAVRLERRRGDKLEFVTVGVLLQRLQHDPRYLRNSVTHVVVDEAHERDALTDFLLVLLKDLVVVESFKVIVMSATLDADLFGSYFPDSATLTVPGRAFPVEEHFAQDISRTLGIAFSFTAPPPLPPNEEEEETKLAPEVPKALDCSLVADVARAVHDRDPTTSTLVFAPGAAEIDKICRCLTRGTAAAKVFPLHGGLPASAQRKIFSLRDEPKIIVATNVAETSLTIDGVAKVVDTGRVREIRYAKKVSKLAECFTSKASAKQRAGRAGRTQPGEVWRLYPKSFFDDALPEYTPAELLRTPLEELILKILRLDLGQPAAFLQKAPEPPPTRAVDAALDDLRAIGAIIDDNDVLEEEEEGPEEEEDPEDDDEAPDGLDDDDEKLFSLSDHESRRLDDDEESSKEPPRRYELTALGYHLASLPMDCRVAKMLIYGCLFDCVEATLTLAAALSASKDCFGAAPFHLKKQASLAKKKLARGSDSDLLALVYAFEAYQKADDKRTFCFDNFVSKQVILEVDKLRNDFRKRLRDAGWLQDKESQQFKEKDSSARYDLATVKAVVAAGLYPQVARAREGALVDREKRRWFCHPGSVNFDTFSSKNKASSSSKSQGGYFVYATKLHTSKPYLCDTNAVDAIGLLLFGGRLRRSVDSQLLVLDDWLPFRTTRHAAYCVCALKREIDATLRRYIDTVHEPAPLREDDEEVLERPDDDQPPTAPSSKRDRARGLAKPTVAAVKHILALLSSS